VGQDGQGGHIGKAKSFILERINVDVGDSHKQGITEASNHVGTVAMIRDVNLVLAVDLSDDRARGPSRMSGVRARVVGGVPRLSARDGSISNRGHDQSQVAFGAATTSGGDTGGGSVDFGLEELDAARGGHLIMG